MISRVNSNSSFIFSFLRNKGITRQITSIIPGKRYYCTNHSTMTENYINLLCKTSQEVSTAIRTQSDYPMEILNELRKSPTTLRSYLHTLLTTAPVDFSIETNSKIGKILEYENKDTKIVKWQELQGENTEKIGVWQGDITTLKIDAIVNAANKYLLGCFQPTHKCIDNVIHSRAGPLLREECRRLVATMDRQRDKTGNARLTLGYNLPAQYVIHTVGPIINKGESEKPDQLASCYLIKSAGLRSIAFCCISTGIFGYPKESAAHVALKTTREWLEEGDNNNHVDFVLFNVFLDEDKQIYDKLIPIYFPQ